VSTIATKQHVRRLHVICPFRGKALQAVSAHAAVSRAVSTDILHLPARVVVTAADRLTLADGPQCPRGVERRKRTADDRPHDDHGAPSAALRPPASGSRPRHRGPDHRHGRRGSSLDGPWLARQGTEGRGKPRRDGPEGIGTPARSPGTPAAREEAHGTTSARARPASKLGMHADARASARRTRQDQDPASRGSCPCVCSVAGAPAVPAIVPESVPCLATPAARVRA
jgi:hypothetical protein